MVISYWAGNIGEMSALFLATSLSYMETKVQILKRRKEIELGLIDLLEETGSDFGLDGLSPVEKRS